MNPTDEIKNTGPQEMPNTLIPTVAELERAYRFFNERLFSGELRDDLVITIQTAGRRRRVSGWHWPDKWSNTKTDTLTEINIVAEHLQAADPLEILLHELCHKINAQHGIKDCTTSQYHNKKFRQAAERVLLAVEKSKTYGHALTSRTPELDRIINEEFKPSAEAFHFKRKGVESAKKGSKLKKWSCGCTNIRAAVEIDVTCNSCGEHFERIGV